MGTRADFYIGRGEAAEWLGSIAWDGYREGIPAYVLAKTDEKSFRKAVKRFLNGRDDATLPENGWPWPWEDSNTTDCSYSLFDGAVYESVGYQPMHWWKISDGEVPVDENEERITKGLEVCVFPNMKNRMNVTMGARSGLVVIGAKP